MRSKNAWKTTIAAAAIVLGLGGCAGISTRDKNTVIGAGVGAVGGAVLTGGRLKPRAAAARRAPIRERLVSAAITSPRRRDGARPACRCAPASRRA